jgi:hypothetical protein
VVERRKWPDGAAFHGVWPGRALMSPAAGRGDMGGEARSKRGGQWGCDGAHRGVWKRMAWLHVDGAAVIRSASVDTWPWKERRGATECSVCTCDGE